MSKTKKKPPRNLVSVDVAEIQPLIDAAMAANPAWATKRGIVIKAALRVGLPMLVSQARSGFG